MLAKFIQDQEGATVIEYGVIIAVVIVIAFLSLLALGVMAMMFQFLFY
jgi:Flp pilus assembly pilin Flp